MSKILDKLKSAERERARDERAKAEGTAELRMRIEAERTAEQSG